MITFKRKTVQRVSGEPTVQCN